MVTLLLWLVKMEFKVDCCNVLNIVKTIAILLIAYFLGYISAHLTNKQIEEYCFNYNMIKAYNYGIEILTKNPLEVPTLNNFLYPYIYVNISTK